MFRRIKIFCLISAVFAAFSCPLAAQTAENKADFTRVADSLYTYTTYRDLDGTPFPANAMYMVTAESVVLIDTPWDTTKYQWLLDGIRLRHGKPVKMCLSTHWHDDRTGGVAYFQSKGIPTFASNQTKALCALKGAPVPQFGFEGDTSFVVDGVSFEVYYPGPGHTVDNIVVWFPKQRVLYAGCAVKSKESKGLGYTGDADLEAWPAAIDAMLRKYPDARLVIPGHFATGGKSLLRWTAKLLAAAKKE